MDHITSCGVFTNNEILKINYCRMFLQAATVSDLCLANGIHGDADIIAGDPSPRSSSSTYLHYNQAKPNKARWKVWKLAMTIWFHDAHKDDIIALRRSLGTWLFTVNSLHCSWPS
jgi:hypothetical protein